MDLTECQRVPTVPFAAGVNRWRCTLGLNASQCFIGVFREKLLISRLQSVLQRDLRAPASRFDSTDIAEFPRSTIWLGQILFDAALKSDDLSDQFRDVSDGDFFAAADVDQIGGFSRFSRWTTPAARSST